MRSEVVPEPTEMDESSRERKREREREREE